MSGDGLEVNLDNQSSKEKPPAKNEYRRASSSSQMSDSEVWNGGQRSDSLVKEKVLGKKDDGYFYPEDGTTRDKNAKKTTGRGLTIKHVTPEELAQVQANGNQTKQLEPK